MAASRRVVERLEQTAGSRGDGPGRSVYKTAIFKIHNPSSHKKASLRHVMSRSEAAYKRLLDRYVPEGAALQKLRSLARARRYEFLRRARQEIELSAFKFQHLGMAARASIARDCLAHLKSLVRQTGPLTGHTAARSGKGDSNGLSVEKAIAALGAAIDEAGESAARKALKNAGGARGPRPLTFYRVRYSDGFLLLRHLESNRLYCWLNLHPKGSRFARQMEVEDFVDVLTGQPIKFRSRTGMLLPLEMGHAYHEQRFLRDGRPRIARLLCRRDRHGGPRDEFELHVSFEWTVRSTEATCVLGIERASAATAVYAVLDRYGEVIEEGRTGGEELPYLKYRQGRAAGGTNRPLHARRGAKRGEWAAEAIHAAANALADKAETFGARIVMADLRSRPARPASRQPNNDVARGTDQILSPRDFVKLSEVLEYKLAERGLPPPLLLRRQSDRQVCPQCGHHEFEPEPFGAMANHRISNEHVCPLCDYRGSACSTNSRIMALRGLWLIGDAKIFRHESQFPLKNFKDFEKFIRNCAIGRGRAPAP